MYQVRSPIALTSGVSITLLHPLPIILDSVDSAFGSTVPFEINEAIDSVLGIMVMIGNCIGEVALKFTLHFFWVLEVPLKSMYFKTSKRLKLFLLTKQKYNFWCN